MSQPQPGVVTRKQAVDSFAEVLTKTSLPTDPKWKRVLSDVLKDFAVTYCDLSLKGPDGHLDLEMRMYKNALSLYWNMYFVLSLRKILKDLPANPEDLRKATRELFGGYGYGYRNGYGNGNGNGYGSAARGNPASSAASSATPATLSEIPRNNVNNNKKRPVTEHDHLDTPNRGKRVKKEADVTNFTVHAKDPYTVHVFEGNIPVAEFSSSTPATVQIKMVQGSAASAAAVVNCDESDN